MQTTNTARTTTVIRKHARRPQPASRHPAPHGPIPSEQPVTQRETEPAAQVLDAFRSMAHGVHASTARDQTEDFYRSGGQDWARALTEQDGYTLKARVVDAFRKTAHGVQDATAHAKTLQFYRSGGQDWTQNLG